MRLYQWIYLSTKHCHISAEKHSYCYCYYCYWEKTQRMDINRWMLTKPIVVIVSLYTLSCSVMSDSLWPHGLLTRLLCPWGFSRQEYWSGLPCPPPGDIPNTGIKPRGQTRISCSSCIAGGFFTAEPPLPAPKRRQPTIPVWTCCPGVITESTILTFPGPCCGW